MAKPPRLHVFGHIHEAHGVVESARTISVNAAICDVAYRPVQPAVVIDLR
jgi:Icc-related predicted phosphoesterase